MQLYIAVLSYTCEEVRAEAAFCIVNLQAGTVTTKNSCSRNLHRLLSSISFISSLLQNLAADKACTLHTATASAYSSTMAPMHNFFVRTAVKGGMYTLPTRAGFLQSIGETGDCNRGISPTFDFVLPLCDLICLCLCVIVPVLYSVQLCSLPCRGKRQSAFCKVHLCIKYNCSES